MLRPQITLLFAQSLDGRIALSQSRTHLSSSAGFQLAHRARAEHGAVLVGSSTVKIDDPQLTVRHVPGPSPRRIVLASRLDVASDARIFAPGPGLLIIGTYNADVARAAALRAAGADVRLVAATSDGMVALPEALRVIYEWGVRRLLVEGGAHVLSAFLRERLADDIIVEIVPKFLGESGTHCVGNIAVSRIEDCPSLSELTMEQVDSSMVIRGKLAR